MAVDVKVNVSAFNGILARLVRPYLLRQAEQIATRARQLAPQASGDLVASIHVEPTTIGAAVVVTAPHAGYVEMGTGLFHTPDARSAYFPALRPRGLILWAQRKGLDPFLVARGIARRGGTQPKPYLEPAVQQILGKFRFRWIRRDVG